jgi:hypothetical protein
VANGFASSPSRPGQDAARLALAAWTATVAVAVLAKLFAAATSALRFDRSLATRDLLGTVGGDAAVALVLLAAILIAGAAASWRGGGWLSRAIGGLALSLLLLLLAFVQLFHGLSAYAFWEWGAFVEPHHLEAGRRAGVTADLVEYALDWRMAAVGALLVGGIAATRFLARRFEDAGIRRRFVRRTALLLALLSIGGIGPWRRPGTFDPSTPSPLLLLARGSEGSLGGLDAGRWPAVEADVAAFGLPPPRLVPPEWESLRGAARGFDLVVVVLESTRRDRLSIFGAERETTPRLRRELGRSLLLEDAWVSQPRSCKTMESLLLGVLPDPRLVSIAWQDDSRLVPDSLLRRLAADGRPLYFGTSLDRATDNFDRFVELAAGAPLSRVVGGSELDSSVGSATRRRDDRKLVADYLAWRAADAAPCGALLWFAGAHHPYRAIDVPFGEETLLDRYDNCVWCTDRALGELFDGIERQGRSDRTLVAVVADHGEALGERLDVLHGSSFYDWSMRVPCLLWSPALFAGGRRSAARFCVKDLPGTLLWMLGDGRPLGQSNVLFGNRRDDPLFFSNVYQDYKLGRLVGDEKVTFRPERDELLVRDLSADPRELGDGVVEPGPRADALRRELVAWYWSQLRALGTERLEVRGRREPASAVDLSIDPEMPQPGDRLRVRVSGGTPGARVVVHVLGIDGAPSDLVVAEGELDAAGTLARELEPATVGGRPVRFQAFVMEKGRNLARSAVVERRLP